MKKLFSHVVHHLALLVAQRPAAPAADVRRTGRPGWTADRQIGPAQPTTGGLDPADMVKPLADNGPATRAISAANDSAR